MSEHEVLVKALQACLDRVPLMRRTTRPQGMAGGKFYASGYEQATLDIARELGLQDELKR